LKISKERIQSIFGRLFFKFKNSVPEVVYSAYTPDSLYYFDKFPEVRLLFNKWIYNNKINNQSDLTRFYSFIFNLTQIIEEGIEGDFAELGVYQGTTASILAHFANKSNRKLYLYDTFDGFDRRDLIGVDASKSLGFSKEFSDTSYKKVSHFVGYENICEYLVGYFPDTVTDDAKKRNYAFVHLDCDLYKPIVDGLEFFWPRLTSGGMIFIHDYSSGYWPGVKQAVDEFCGVTGCFVILLPDKSGTAVIRKDMVG